MRLFCPPALRKMLRKQWLQCDCALTRTVLVVAMHDMNCGCKSVSKKNHPVLTCKRSLNERLDKRLKNLGFHINRPISSSMDTTCLDTPTNQIYEIYRSLVEKTYPMLKMNVYIFSVKTPIFYLICTYKYTDWLLGEPHHPLVSTKFCGFSSRGSPKGKFTSWISARFIFMCWTTRSDVFHWILVVSYLIGILI